MDGDEIGENKRVVMCDVVYRVYVRVEIFRSLPDSMVAHLFELSAERSHGGRRAQAMAKSAQMLIEITFPSVCNDQWLEHYPD